MIHLCVFQALQTELLRKSRDYEALNVEGQRLMKCSEQDQDVVQEQLDDLNRRWDKLNLSVSERVAALEDMAQRTHEFADIMDGIGGALKKYEDRMQAHHNLGPAGNDTKHLDKIKVSHCQ